MDMKKKLCVGAMLTAVLLSACQKNPESSIVVNKDMDRLIEEAQKDDGSTGNMEAIAGDYDVYQTSFSNEALGVNVNVNATVDIPQTDRMSVIRVKQQAISQELLSKVIEELCDGETLYEGALTSSVRTQSSIESDIKESKDAMKEIESDTSMDASDKAIVLQEYQQQIDAFQEEYENAPEEIQWADYESDGLLHSVAQLNEENSGNDFYSWAYSLNTDGEIYYGVSDGADGAYISLYVQNNKNYGNCLRYRREKHGYIFTASAFVRSTVFDSPYADGVWLADEDIAEDYANVMMDGVSLVEYTDETTTISEAEARSMADEFLKKLGLEDYSYSEGGLYSENVDIRENVEAGYRKTYILRYIRKVDGAFVTYDSTSKHEEGWDGDSYVKKDWPIETIEFRINDSGIVGFDYNAPLELTETVVDKASMKSFDEIKNIFETMVMVKNTSSDTTQENKVNIQVDRVILGYARISEADSYDTGLLVPVWDFYGTITDSYGSESTGSVLTVNAIDGSIIDRSLGY
jgi:hypothetical protein